MADKTDQGVQLKRSEPSDQSVSAGAEAPGDAHLADVRASPDSPSLLDERTLAEDSRPQAASQNAAGLHASDAQDLTHNMPADPPTSLEEQSTGDASQTDEPVQDPSPATAPLLGGPDATPVEKSDQDGQPTLSDSPRSDAQVEPAHDLAQQVAASQVVPPAPLQPVVKPLGAFKLWTVDDNGVFVSAKPNLNGATVRPTPDPAAAEAVDIYMSPTGRASDDQAKLYDDVNAVLDVVRRLYLPDGTRPNASKFRTYYVRIFRLAQVGLEGTDPSPKQSKGALESLKASLLDDEGLNVKTKNLSALGWTAWRYSWPMLLVYGFLRLVGPGKVDALLNTLQISRVAAANLILLWIGCFVGVCLSYGVRTSTLTLTDLVTPGPDRLSPSLRLLFIGTLTMFFGLLFMMKIVELKIGEYSTASIGNDPSLAFIVGILFGLSESVLPGLAGKRAESFLKGLQ